ncbi:MAG: aquaporin [Bacteroidetes bacterium]|nr:aquaporin [Bacteroidota bacterium]
MIKKLVAEALGTFGIVFCGTGAIIINQHTNGAIGHAGIAITFGFIVTVMIYVFGNISGAHLNPAVSIALSAIKLFPVNHLAGYVTAQCIGALCASALLKFLFPLNELLGSTTPAGSLMQSLVFEFILTFILMLSILFVAKGEFSKIAGIVIGMVILLEAMFAGPVSGASMNPARSLAPALLSMHMSTLWIYLLAPITGAIGAAFLWRWLTANRN